MKEAIKRLPFRDAFLKGTAEQPLTAGKLRKRDNMRRVMLRTLIQILFFLLAPSLFTSAFTGVKRIFTAIGQGQPLEANGFVWALIGLCLFTMLAGRFFCGFACPFGALGDLIYYLSGKIQKRLKRKLPRLPDRAARYLSYLPYGILTAIVALCAAGVYGRLSGWSPWDVFSMLTARNFQLERYAVGLALLGAILVGMAFVPRFFCRFLCPMGAVFRLLPVMPWAVLRRDREQCIKTCSACKTNCPVGLELGGTENAGDCIRCGKCQNVCPKGNITSGVKKIRGNELWLTGLKAAALLGIAWAVGALRI